MRTSTSDLSKGLFTNRQGNMSQSGFVRILLDSEIGGGCCSYIISPIPWVRDSCSNSNENKHRELGGLSCRISPSFCGFWVLCAPSFLELI